jgi:hypothetical protein
MSVIQGGKNEESCIIRSPVAADAGGNRAGSGRKNDLD